MKSNSKKKLKIIFMLNLATIALECFHYNSKGVSARALWRTQLSLHPKPSSQARARNVPRPIQNISQISRFPY